jgi:hypothetical protein
VNMLTETSFTNDHELEQTFKWCCKLPSRRRIYLVCAGFPPRSAYANSIISYCPTPQGGAGALLTAYKFNGGGGKPQFTLAGKSAIQFAGVGAPTVTSLNGQAGTGIVSSTVGMRIESNIAIGMAGRRQQRLSGL